jgi:C-terminal processing protease CtpA/Prc
MNNILKFTIISVSAIAVINSCGSRSIDDEYNHSENINTNSSIIISSDDVVENDNTVLESSDFDFVDKKFLYALFLSEYLWYDEVEKNIDTSLFTSPQEMIDSLKYKMYDRWSYAQTRQQYENFTNQVSTGSFGFYYNKDFQVIETIIGSPSQKAGLLRGDILIHINEQNVTRELIYEPKQYINEPVEFSVIRKNKVIKLEMAPTIYQYKVSSYQILQDESGKKIGHFIYDQFTSSSIEEIDEAFNEFKKNNIDELIIDLRYNGGGALNTASILLDKIAGYNNDTKLQFYLNYNDKMQSSNESYYFDKDDNSLSSLKRVFFLTTDQTASASEVVINSLRSYMDVKLIGSTTHGKPTGMSGKDFGEYIYWLINFTILNADHNGEFYGGMLVNCESRDNINYLRDDVNGNMLKEALYYIKTNTCLSGN